ncbi:MAG TPA: isoprenylcysteine carboxylmethyltransferase family protein [Aggregatilineales bacterium]|nr:isoprenylcysteine carboxylmethyltransferase family protein [Aggregatilineales bacterium]
MTSSLILYAIFLLAVSAGRLIEMAIGRRHQRILITHGARNISDPVFPWIVILHVGILLGSFLEAWLLKRPFVPVLALPMIVFFMLANALRWWVIATMAEHWNVRVMDSLDLGVVSHGPFRFIRHPNYLALFVELLAIPLIHTAYLTAILGTLAHLWILRSRIATEESVLLANHDYLATMGAKPRFVPRLRWTRPKA